MIKRLISALIITSLILAILPCTICCAAEPKVSRDYISTRTSGVTTKEEKVNVDFKDIDMIKGSFVRISFIDSDGLVINKYDFDLPFDGWLNDEFTFDPQQLSGTEKIKIQFFGQNNDSNDITVSLNI